MLRGRFWVPWTWAFCHENERLKVCLSHTQSLWWKKGYWLKMQLWLGCDSRISLSLSLQQLGFVLDGREYGIQRTTLALPSMSFMWAHRRKKELVDLTAKNLILITVFFTQLRNRSPCTKENGDLFDVTRLGIGPRIIFLVYGGWKAKMVMSSVAEICAGAL